MTTSTMITKEMMRKNDRKAKAVMMPFCVAVKALFLDYKRYRNKTKKEIDIPECVKRLNEVIDSGSYRYAISLSIGFAVERELKASIERNKTILRRDTTLDLQKLIARQEKLLSVYQQKREHFKTVANRIYVDEHGE